MKRQISFRQYRAIDLGLFALLLLASEALLVTAATRWFPEQPYTVSVSAAVTAIVLLRRVRVRNVTLHGAAGDKLLTGRCETVESENLDGD